MALDKPIDQISAEDILALVDNKVPEGKALEYKRDVVGNADDEKREFRADVSSFANALGGYLVFGIDEEDGVAVAAHGIATADADAEILRLEAMIRDSIQPRIPNVQARAVVLPNGNCCIIIRIPKSWAMPHAVLHKKYMQFFARTSNGKFMLDVPEIKTAFLLADITADHIRQFRAERLSKIMAADAPVPLAEAPKIIYHLLPITAFDPSITVNLGTLVRNVNQENGMRSWGHNHRYNFDGLLFHNASEYLHVQPESKASNYALAFHNGAIEAVDTVEQKDVKRIEMFDIENTLLESLPILLTALHQFGVEPPVFLLLSVVGVSGLAITGDSRTGKMATNPIDRDVLIFSEVIIEDFTMSLELALKPIFDRLWNAVGEAGSPSYDRIGNWDERHRRGHRRH